MNIRISVGPKWLFSENGKHTNTIGLLREKLKEKTDPQFEEKDFSISDCEIIYDGSLDAQSVTNEIVEMIKCVTGSKFSSELFKITIQAGEKRYAVDSDGKLKEDSPSDLFLQINALRSKQDQISDGTAIANPSEEVQKPAQNDDISASLEKKDVKISSPPESEQTKENREEKSSSLNDSNKKKEVEKTEEIDKKGLEEKTKESFQEEKRSAYEQILAMVGNKAFKQLAEDIRNTADYMIRHKTQSVFFSEAFLFSVDTGSGYHSSLSLLNMLLKEVGLFNNETKAENISLPSFYDHDVTSKMNNIISVLENALEKQRLLSIDISEWLGHTHTREFKKVAMTLFRNNDKCMIIFRVPYVRQEMLDATVRDLSDIISTRPVVFEPFTGSELKEIALRYLDKHAFSFTDKAWEVFNRQIEEEKSDGYFYGVHTVHKLVGDIIRKKELIVAKTGEDDKLVTDEIAASFDNHKEQSHVENLDTIRSMIGMEAIADKLTEIINQIVFSRKSNVTSKPTMHMCFVGNPGTGKTTVARILGNVLKEKGILRIGKFYEHHGRDFCAEYVGQTAPKTRSICQEAYGSVLFIDEAYSLANEIGRYDYGKEAIDTLITEMENNSDDLIVILAGYPDEINKMISMNPGMRSRVPYTIEFPNYTHEQLFEIFMGMVRKNFSCTDDLKEQADRFFGSIPDSVLEDKTFGNGRFVRNIFEHTWGKAITRCSESGFDGIVINGEDFKAAIEDFDFASQVSSKRKIGF